MAVGREIRGGFDHRLFDGLVNPVCQIGFAPGALKQRLDAAILYRSFIAVEDGATCP